MHCVEHLTNTAECIDSISNYNIEENAVITNTFLYGILLALLLTEFEMHRCKRIFIVCNILLSFVNFGVCQLLAPASPPYNVKAKAVSQTTALIQWKPPQEPNGEIEVRNNM